MGRQNRKEKKTTKGNSRVANGIINLINRAIDVSQRCQLRGNTKLNGINNVPYNEGLNPAGYRSIPLPIGMHLTGGGQFQKAGPTLQLGRGKRFSESLVLVNEVGTGAGVGAALLPPCNGATSLGCRFTRFVSKRSSGEEDIIRSPEPMVVAARIVL